MKQTKFKKILAVLLVIVMLGSSASMFASARVGFRFDGDPKGETTVAAYQAALRQLTDRADAAQVSVVANREDGLLDNSDLKALAAEVTKNCATDADKVSAIHDWVCATLYFDEALERAGNVARGSGETEAQYLLRRIDEAQCEQLLYSRLFVALCLTAGIPAYRVFGVLTPQAIAANATLSEVLENYTAGHFIDRDWAVYYVDGAWHYADCLRDSGNRVIDGVKTAGAVGRAYVDLSTAQMDQNYIAVSIYGLPIDGYELNIYGPDFENGALWETTLAYYYGKDYSVYVPADFNITTVDAFCFSGRSDIMKIVLPEGVRKVGLDSCFGLQSIYLPKSVTEIDDDFSFQCDHLMHIYYGGSKSDWKQIDTHADIIAELHYNASPDDARDYYTEIKEEFLLKKLFRRILEFFRRIFSFLPF